MVLDATANCHEPVTRERLFAWHAALFRTGYSGLSRIKVGQWRDDANGPMQVVSGISFGAAGEASSADAIFDIKLTQKIIS